jgi:hypothetical protein
MPTTTLCERFPRLIQRTNVPALTVTVGFPLARTK